MVKEVEGTIDIEGKSLYTKSWLPDTNPPKANLVFIHGFSDHVNRYNELMTYLASRGIAVHGFDQRGWGRSVARPAERGLTGPTARVLADMAAFIRRVHAPPGSSSSSADQHPQPQPPLFVMGHSMGGGQVLRLMCHSDTDDGAYADLVRGVRGWVVEAPYLGLAPEEQPSWLTVLSLRLVGKLLPRMHYVHEIDPASLSRIPEVQRSVREDPLMHNTGTLEGMASMLDRTADLSAGRTRPRAPGNVRALWVGHGSADKATAYSETKKWFDNCAAVIEDREMKTYEGAYHQLHADLCKDEFAKDVADWISARCDGVGEAAPEAEAAGTKPVGSKL